MKVLLLSSLEGDSRDLNQDPNSAIVSTGDDNSNLNFEIYFPNRYVSIRNKVISQGQKQARGLLN